MKRNDIVMTPELQGFLEFDLGHMQEQKFTKKVLDIPYCQSGLTLDIYYPHQGKDSYPVFLIVYGGGWVSGFKRSKFVEPMLKPLDYGYACVVAEYTLALDAAFPQAILDLKNAIGWIQNKGSEYKLNPADITVWGESAGSHLALEAVILPDDKYASEYEVSPVQNLVVFYPPVDITTMDEQMKQNFPDVPSFYRPDSVFGIFLGPGFYDPQVIYDSNPIHYLKDPLPRIWIQHGQSDNMVPWQQSLQLSQAILNKVPKAKIHYEITEGKVHTDPWFFGKENLERILAFINE